MVHPGEIAKQYAEAHGLEYRERGSVPFPPAQGELASLFCYAVVGPLAGSAHQGLIYMHAGRKALGPPGAQFALSGLDGVLEGFAIRRSGTNFLTSQPLPKHYVELKDLGEFGTRFRAGVPDAADEQLARSLLSSTFTAWYLEHGPQGKVTSQAGALDIAGGVVFVRSLMAYSSVEELGVFAGQAAGLADRIQAWLTSRA